MANLAKIPPMPQDAPPSLMDPAAMEAPPDMGTPAAPMVSRIPTQGEQNIAHDQAKLEKVQWNQEHPWGTPENHPGKLGKIAHAFSTLGNIAGDIVAPNVMANIPQTQLGMKTEEGQLAKRIGTEQTEESQNQEREAQTKKAEEDALLEPGKAASEEGLQGVETQAKQQALDMGPTLIQGHAHAVQQAIKNGRDPGTDPLVQQYEDAIQRIQKQPAAKAERPDTPEQQYIDEYQKNHPGAGVGEAERQYTLDTQRPPQIAPVMMMVPQPGGGATATVVRPGQTVAPGATTASQFGQGGVADVKEQKAEAKQSEALNADLNLMKQFAANPSPTNDAAMLMHYIGATKPESMGKIRLNDRELKLFGGTRSSIGDAEALLTKIANGQSLTPKQRTDMVNTVGMIAAASKRGGGEAAGTPPPGATIIKWSDVK